MERKRVEENTLSVYNGKMLSKKHRQIRIEVYGKKSPNHGAMNAKHNNGSSLKDEVLKMNSSLAKHKETPSMAETVFNEEKQKLKEKCSFDGAAEEKELKEGAKESSNTSYTSSSGSRENGNKAEGYQECNYYVREGIPNKKPEKELLPPFLLQDNDADFGDGRSPEYCPDDVLELAEMFSKLDIGSSSTKRNILILPTEAPNPFGSLKTTIGKAQGNRKEFPTYKSSLVLREAGKMLEGKEARRRHDKSVVPKNKSPTDKESKKTTVKITLREIKKALHGDKKKMKQLLFYKDEKRWTPFHECMDDDDDEEAERAKDSSRIDVQPVSDTRKYHEDLLFITNLFKKTKLKQHGSDGSDDAETVSSRKSRKRCFEDDDDGSGGEVSMLNENEERTRLPIKRRCLDESSRLKYRAWKKEFCKAFAL